MPQPGRAEPVKFVRHLPCPKCLNPMRIRTAATADGRETIRFGCENCGTEAIQDDGPPH
jgi:predicted RNA-binding Zn-ribbon protein involved in translation (DUF1610 family)